MKKILMIGLMIALLMFGSIGSKNQFATAEGYSDFQISNPIDIDYDVELKALNTSNEYCTLKHIELEYKYVSLWDEELNSIYQKLLAILETDEQEILKKAQRGWLQYHEQENNFYSKVFYERSSGPVLGSLGRIEAIINYKERIRQRTLELLLHYYQLGFEVEFEYEHNRSLILSLVGVWEGIDNDQFHGTELTININGENSFEFDMQAFWLNSEDFAHVGVCSGKGYIKSQFIELDIEEGAVKGILSLNDGKLHIDYLGDMSLFGGLNVVFSTDFIKKSF